MNAIDRAPAQTSQAAHPRIRYIDPLALGGAELGPVLDRAAAQGFTAVMVPPPWAPGPDGDRFAPVTLDRAHPALGGGEAEAAIRRFAHTCREHGLAPLMDVPLASIAVGFEGDAAPFAAPGQLDPLDPRHGGPARTRAVADPDALGPWWAGRLGGWMVAGLAGIRVLGLGEAPGAMAALRAHAPDALLIAWTPGMSREALAHVQGASFVCSSQAWWDYRAAWFWDELAVLRQVAPVLACPEAPFGARAAAGVQDPARLADTLRRAASVAVITGEGWLVPAGFETGARRGLDPAGRATPEAARLPEARVDLAAFNRHFAQSGPAGLGTQLLTGTTTPLAVLRTDAADARFAHHARLALLNTDDSRPRTLDPASLLAEIDGAFTAFTAPGGDAVLRSGSPITLAPGELAVFAAQAVPPGATVRPLDEDAARRFADGPRVAIEAPSPCVSDGALPAKRLVGEVVAVEADVVGDGHEVLAVAMQWREPGSPVQHEVRMRPVGNDRYRADLPLTRIGAWEYGIQAWRDAFASYRDEIAKKSAAGVPIGLELREGVALLDRTATRAQGAVRDRLAEAQARLAQADDAGKLAIFLSADFGALMAEADDRPRSAALPRPVRIDAERSGAAFSAWYEVFPRSMSDDPNRHGTFRDVERHLPRVRAMGFDVLYFPPIHPIGRVNRKGPNNTLTPAEGDPGSPYAIGAAEGGHDALHPELGTLEDFRHLVAAAAEHGLEIAIDFAIQCSPDHPWLKQHRDWFDWRPDGSIKYAENPPKKYQDIVNVDFYAAGSVPGLWVALADVVMFWMAQGVRCIRVDNPHTKPLPFWQWMIGSVRERYPDAVFLAEAFTRPKVMYRLAKVGFSQSYSYFTWRETKREMEAYLTELAEPGPREFFRPHFFVNTPDINPVYLQGAGRSAYLVRAALAATLSGLWGVYNGFELCEGTPVPGREEYLDSEKYQVRAWDWDRPGNIVAEITALNRIRRAQPALRTHLNTTFLPAGNDVVSVYMKATPDRANVLVIAVCYDPDQPQESDWEFPFWVWQADENAAFEAEDLFTGEVVVWRNKYQRVRLDPARPYAIWRVTPATPS